jgi:quinol monooxygenase YgiN
MPICIVVEAEIVEDRMDEFLDMIEKNAVGSRAEPGCIRFGAYRHAIDLLLSFFLRG